MPNITVSIRKGEEMYVGEALEVDVVTQGETVEATLANLREALALYFEDEEGTELLGNEPAMVTTVTV